VLSEFPRCFAFDEFGPLAIHPVSSCCWAKRKKPQRNRANYHKTCGVAQFRAAYSYGDDTLFGVVRSKKSAAKSRHQELPGRPGSERIHVIPDNLSAHKGKKIGRWCEAHNVELCFTHTYFSRANPAECHFGPLREFRRRLIDCEVKPTRWRVTGSPTPSIARRLSLGRCRCHSHALSADLLALLVWGEPIGGDHQKL